MRQTIGPFNRQFTVESVTFGTSTFEKQLNADHPVYDVRWIAPANGQLEELYFYIPDLDSLDLATSAPNLEIIDMHVERTIFPNEESVEVGGPTWSAVTEVGTGWYKVTDLGNPWVLAQSSYRIEITTPSGVELIVPYMWPRELPTETVGETAPVAQTIVYRGSNSVLVPWAMPIMKAQIYQQMPEVMPTETYGAHVWENVLDPYTPAYGILVKSLRDTYRRLTIDYARYGEEWSGITVPVTFQSNMLGGGMFSYVLSQPITSFHLNHSFLTTYLLMNVLGGRLTSHTYGNFEIFGEATRTLHAYDELFYDRTGFFNVPEWDLDDVDGQDPEDSYALYDPGEDLGGKYGADWYIKGYNEETWLEDGQDLSAELLLRMPTLEPWQWEMPDETGTLARCPVVELEEIEVTLKVNRFLLDALSTDADPANDDRIWVHLQLRTMFGAMSNSSLSVDLSEAHDTLDGDDRLEEVEVTITIDMGSMKLWDAKKYKEEESYRRGIIGAPYLSVQIFDADPARYFLDTGNRFFTVLGSDIQELGHTSYMKYIDDQQERRAFYMQHLLDSEFIGINTEADQSYIDKYNSRMDAYKKWVEEQSGWTEQKIIRVLFAVACLIYSIATLIATEGASAGVSFSGIIFAVDQLQSTVTGQSIFSKLFGVIVLPIMGAVYAAQGKAWTEEQWEIAMERFNIFSPFTRKDTGWQHIANALISTVIMILLQKGLSKLGDALFKPHLTQLQQLKVKIAMGKGTDFDKLVCARLDPELSKIVEGSLSKLGAELAQAVEDCIGRTVKQITTKLNTLAKTFLEDAGIHLGMPFWYKVIYVAKQAIGGLISPTEWFEALWFLGKGIMFDISNPVGNFLWNYGDNILFAVFEDDSTWGMIQTLSAAAQGDYSGFVQYWHWY